MEQICSSNGDKCFVYAPSNYHNKVSELNNLEKGDKSKAEYEVEKRRLARNLVTTGGNLFMGKYYLDFILKEEGINLTT